MLTYKGVTYHEDVDSKIVYFFNDSRLEFCKGCPMKGTGQAEIAPNVTLVSMRGCPCSNLRAVASASISSEAYHAIKETGAFDEFMDTIRNNDSPIGGVHIEPQAW